MCNNPIKHVLHENIMESRLDVSKLLEVQKETFRKQLIIAKEYGLQDSEYQKKGIKVVNDHPKAVVSVKPEDAHLYLVLVGVASELSDVVTSGFSGLESVDHEGSHATEVLKAGGDVISYNILVRTNEKGHFLPNPFISYTLQKDRFIDKARIILAPIMKSGLSANDRRDLAKLLWELVTKSNR